MTFEREYARRGSERDIGIGAAPGRGGAVQLRGVPGKSTLVEHEAQIHTAAARGTAGPGGPLPHLATIQRCFGRHDVTGIAAHTGGAAAEATAAIGAEAFATGHHVAFGGAPSLHTAAHEAAHVIQQRAGVSLKGGVGQAGDPHEQHADAVADRVVRGESAEALLDAYAGSGGGAAVQCMGKKTDKKPAKQKPSKEEASNDNSAKPEIVQAFDDAYDDNAPAPRPFAEEIFKLSQVPHDEAPGARDLRLARLSEIHGHFLAAKEALAKAQARGFIGYEQKCQAFVDARLPALEKALGLEAPAPQAAPSKAELKGFKTITKPPPKPVVENQPLTPVSTADLKMRICQELEVDTSTYVTLPDTVSFGGVPHNLHVSMIFENGTFALDDPQQLATALKAVHITAEQFGKDHKDNPRAWRTSGWVPKLSDKVANKDKADVASAMEAAGHQWDDALAAALKFLRDQQDKNY